MSSVEQEALARNDRFLREFVEAFELCPYARRCRESGRLHRRVMPELAVEPVLHALAELTSPAFELVEVGLLIFPQGQASYLEFTRFAATIRERHQGAANGFFIVPFHPEAPEDTTSPSRLVSFLRRSPDPTLQLVRIELLERVRGPNTRDTVWMDPATIAQGLPEPAPLSTSERIAQHGFETVQRVGADHLRALLDSLRG